jgi:hypothetical protein
VHKSLKDMDYSMLSEKFLEVLSSGRTLVYVYFPLTAISTPFSKASFTRLEVSLRALVNRLLPYHTFPCSKNTKMLTSNNSIPNRVTKTKYSMQLLAQ